MAEFIQRGGTGGGTYAGNFTGKLTVTEESYSVQDNTSYVYYKLELISGSSGRFSDYSADYTVTLNGTLLEDGSGVYSSMSYNTAQTICEGHTTIGHNADGTKTISCSAELNFASGTYSPGSFNPSGDMTLTTIPRASSITATDANIGSASTININRASSGFTHTITYNFKGLIGTIATKTSQTSLGWNIPIEFFEKIPEKSSGTVTLTCQTYNGNTSIGTKTTTMTVRVPTDGLYNSTPIIDSASAIDINSNTLALTNDNTRLVNYQSNVKVNAIGRTINYAIFNNIKSNNEVMTATTSSDSGTTTVTAEKIHNSSIATEYKVVLEDKRGLKAERILNQANQDFVLVPYIPITMSLNAERISPTSNSIILNFSGNFYNGYYDENNINFNDVTIKWRYKEVGGDWITTGADDTTNGWHNLALGTDYQYTQNENKYGSIGNITLANVFNYQKQYIVEVYYQDRLTNYATQKTIAQGIPIYDAGVDRYGNNYFNVNGEIYQNNIDINDKFVYSTTEKIVGKWINGKPIYRKTLNFTATTAYQEQTIAHNVQNADDIWLCAESFLRTDTNFVPLNHYRQADVYIYCLVNTTNIRINVGAPGWLNKPIYATIEYTKTTD